MHPILMTSHEAYTRTNQKTPKYIYMDKYNLPSVTGIPGVDM